MDIASISNNILGEGSQTMEFWLMTNLTHSFFKVFISRLYMFPATSAHHQEDQIVLIHNTHQSVLYQMMY
jgi:hypothetical protein